MPKFTQRSKLGNEFGVELDSEQEEHIKTAKTFLAENVFNDEFPGVYPQIATRQAMAIASGMPLSDEDKAALKRRHELGLSSCEET